MQDEFSGSLYEMFSQSMFDAELKALPGMWEVGIQAISLWLQYDGPDCSPFKCYTRFSKDQIVLANLIGSGNRSDEVVIRKGRMPKIIEACFKVAPKVVVESVISPQLRTYLTAVGFTPSPEYHLNYFKLREDD